MIKDYILIMHFGEESIYFPTECTTAKAAYKTFLHEMKKLKVEASFTIENADFLLSVADKKGEFLTSTRTLISTLEFKDGEMIETECNEIIKDSKINLFEFKSSKNS